MDAALAEFAAAGGVGSREEPLAFSLARTMCALLEEDRDQAIRELQAAATLERDIPSIYPLSGPHGIGLLLDALSGTVDRARYEEVSTTASSGIRWNRQFCLFANAVLLGRERRGDEAEEAMDMALHAAAPYPTALALGLRLVADAAHEDGWGDPVVWLRRAEHHFHHNDVPAVANACRAALRRLGAPVHQRRIGTSNIPQELRACGVTVREFEVFTLLAEHRSNKGIGDHLHISPRTVEKHIASLIAKTDEVSRAALSVKSATLQASDRQPLRLVEGQESSWARHQEDRASA
ncbi:helix-turn-helix transcriptional regulator [Streptomyces sp. NPDC050549]|uniref:helix-turn-helix transcriptional regulator n=1 Tax=Streptomyces sp. NPDC050549 TaxID=3155406 RepID=UPI003414CF9B